jgi:transcriptional regulator GlxA family with amidase domain
MHAGIVVNPGYLATALASITDIMTTANTLRNDVDLSVPVFSISLIGATQTVASSGPISCRIDEPLQRIGTHDITIVVGSAATTIDEVVTQLSTPAAKRTLAVLSSVGPHVPIAAACTGTFMLAEAGQLNDRRATTSWWLAPQFAARYPNVELDQSAMVISDQTRLTAGAAFAHIDLALSIVGAVSADLAQATARFLLIDQRPSQSAFAAVNFLAVTDNIAVEFERHVRARLNQPLELAAIGEALGVSRRTLERRIRRAFGLSPLSLIQQLRVEQARHLKKLGTLNTDQIASAVGYQNGTTLRKLLRSN